LRDTHIRRAKVFRSSAGLLAAALSALAGCGGAAADPIAVDAAAECIVNSPGFEAFRTWETFPMPDSPAQGTVHIAGPKTDFLNKRPPSGSTEFPLCTIIVKEIEVDGVPFQDRQVFALVKRGGSYDQSPAPGWEWFELLNNPDGSFAQISWRGFGPPAGNDMYGGDPMACITCHSNAKNNDYVQSPPLQLSNF
jgi:hypothetical protein